MKKILLFTFTLFVLHNSFGQTTIDQAWEEYNARNYQRVIDLCKKLADSGDNEARCLMYYALDKQNKGMQGLPYVKLAANSGSSRATYLMGYLYEQGELVPKDISKAEYWYKKCISGSKGESFVNWAKVNLALIYNKRGLKEDSKKLLTEAYKNGDKEIAPRLLALLFYKGVDESRAVGLLRIAAENGDTRAQSEMGNYFEEGKYVEKDYGEAAKWYLLAAEQGDWGAQNNLGGCFEKKYRKTLDERDLRQCLKWYYIARKDDKVIDLGNTNTIKKDENGNWIIEDAEEVNQLKKFYDEGCLNAKDYKNFQEWQDKVVAKLAVDSDVDVNIPNSNVKNNDVYALIICNENYSYEQYVPYAENDGKTFGKYCKKTMGIPSKNIHLVVDAGLNKMKRELDWLAEIAVAQSAKKVIIYYSGHGMPANDLSTSYLLPVDGYAKNPTTGLSLNELYASLSKINAESLVVLDACFSGSNKMGDAMEKSKGVALKVKQSAPQGKIIVFSACQGGETAHTYTDQKHSLFTYYFLKALQNGGIKDNIGSFFNKVQSDVTKNSISICGKLQRPEITTSYELKDSWKSSPLVP